MNHQQSFHLTPVKVSLIAALAWNPLHAETIYKTGFESPEFHAGALGTGTALQTQSDTWSLFTTSAESNLSQLARVQSSAVRSGGQAIAIQSSAAASAQGGISTELPNEDKVVTFEADLRLASSSSPTNWQLAVGDSSATGGFVGGVNIAADNGRFQIITDGYPETDPVITRNTWHHIAMEFDVGKQTFKILVDGGTVAKDVPFLTHADKATLLQFATFGGGNDVGYFDNFALSNNLAPEISVEQPVGSGLTDGKSRMAFGSAKVGSKGTTKTFTLINTGTKSLTGLAVTKSGSDKSDFIIGDLGAKSLAPGAKTSFKVTFKPKRKGTRSAALHIKSSDKDENPFDIKVAGNGTAK